MPMLVNEAPDRRPDCRPRPARRSSSASGIQHDRAICERRAHARAPIRNAERPADTRGPRRCIALRRAADRVARIAISLTRSPTPLLDEVQLTSASPAITPHHASAAAGGRRAGRLAERSPPKCTCTSAASKSSQRRSQRAEEEPRRDAAQYTAARGLPRATEAFVSTALAIAGVTQVLRDLLNDRLRQSERRGSDRAERHGEHHAARQGGAAERRRSDATQSLHAPGHAQPRLAQRRPAVARRLGAHASQQSAAGASTCTT